MSTDRTPANPENEPENGTEETELSLEALEQASGGGSEPNPPSTGFGLDPNSQPKIPVSDLSGLLKKLGIKP